MATKHIPLTDIVDNPFQPRTDFDPAALQSLANEIQAEGFWSGSLQGRRTKNGKIELVFGHRRLRALKLLKTESIPIEIVDLTDAQMALRSLEENLQREGLTDLEKADAIKQAVDIAAAERQTVGKPARGAITEIADRLGLDKGWVSDLCQISLGMPNKLRVAIEAKYLTAQTAFEAKKWGGDEYAQTLALQGKEAAQPDSKGTKPTHMTVSAMRKVVKQAPETIQEKLKEAIWSGDVTTPKEAEQKGRRMAAERTKRNKRPPEDLTTVLVGWTHRLEDWTKQLRDVVPYVDYLDEVPTIATPFRAALQEFLDIAQTLLEDEPTSPRTVGRGQSAAATHRRKRLSA